MSLHRVVDSHILHGLSFRGFVVEAAVGLLSLFSFHCALR